MRDIGIRLVVDDSQKSKFAGFATAAQRATDDLNARFNNPLAQYDYALNRAGASLANIGRRIFTDVTAGAVGLTVAVGGLSKVLIDVNERFSQLQITMASSLRSFQAARQVVKEVMAISAQSAVPYSALANAANVMAASPQMSGLLQKQINTGGMSNPQGELQRYLGLIQAMQIYRPDRTPDQAIFSVRAAMGNQWRSMSRVYQMNQRDVSQISGISESDMRKDPAARLKAIQQTFGNIVSPEATVAYSRQPTPLMENIREMGLDRPMRMIGEGAEGSPQSPYNQILIRFQKMFDSLTNFIGKTFEEKFAPRLRDAVSKTFDKLFGSGMSIFSQILDAGGIAGEGAGLERVVEGMTTAVEKILKLVTDVVKMAADGGAVGKVIEFVSAMTNFVKKIIDFFLFVEDKLAPLTFDGVGFLALMSAPAMLSNMGTMLRFFSTSLPTTLMNLFKLASGAEAGKFVNTFSGVGNVLGRGNASGTNPFDRPMWASNTPGRMLSGLDYQTYKAQLLSNPVLSGMLDEKTYGMNKQQTNLATNRFIQGQYRQDLRYVTDPKNQAVIQQLLMAGMGGGQMAGIGTAAELERKFAPPGQGGFGSLMKKAGSAIGGVAIGTGVAFAAAEGISLVVAGLKNVYVALTENSDAIRENTVRKTEARNQLISNTLGNAEIRANAAAIGGSIKDFLPSNFLKQTDSAQTLVEVANRYRMNGGKSPDGQITNKIFSNLGGLFAGGPMGPMTGLGFGMTNRAIDYEAASNRGFGDFGSIVDSSKDILGLTDANAKTLKKLGETDIRKAVETYYKLINKMEGGIVAFQKAVEAKYSELAQTPLEASREATVSLYGDFGNFINRVNNKSANGGDMNEVLGGLLRSRSGFSQQNPDGRSMESLLSSAHQIGQMNTNPLAAKVLGETDSEYDKIFWAKDAAEQMNTLMTLRQDMEKQAGDLLAGFRDSSKNISEVISSYLEKNPTGELSETLRKVQADPSKLNSVKAQLENSIKTMSTSGVTLTTALGVYYDIIGRMIKDGESFTSEELEQVRTHLSPILTKFGIDVSAFGGSGSSTGQSKMGKAQFKQGRVEGISASLEATLRNVKPANMDGERVVELIKQLLPQLDRSSNINQLKVGDAQASMLNSLGNSRSLSRSRFRRQLSAASTSTGGEDFTSAASLKNFVSSLGYNVGNDREAALSNLLPKTRGFDAQTSITNAMKIQKHIMEEMVVSQETRNEAQRTYNALLEQQQELMARTDPANFWAGFREGASTAYDELNDFVALGKSAGDLLRDGLGNALGDIATGAKNVGDAFKDMATSILQAMSRILAQKAAEYLLNLLFSAIMPTGRMGTAAEGAAVNTAVFGDSLVGAAPAAGGIGRALGGPVWGGSGVRDDVPAMLMGGEFVINKRAAQSIGYDALHAMNSGRVQGFAAGGLVGSGMLHGVTNNGGSKVVNISVTVNNNDGRRNTEVQGEQDKQIRAFTEGLEALVDEKLMKHMRPGGMFRPTNA